ncbi:hypothetical protein ACFYXS_05075 [Streptomyces sp. NPDC002574]|uniref:hypothetical protein n=1 Tax=Streptomyces sp. NPDC002574 TaxID=3364652 RepID=UPI0036BAF598
MIDAGLEALLAGVECPSLALLAGLRKREEPDAPELFAQVLEELGLVPGLPTDSGQALLEMARSWAILIVHGKLDPVEGADMIWWRASTE